VEFVIFGLEENTGLAAATEKMPELRIVSKDKDQLSSCTDVCLFEDLRDHCILN
jgi:hypothetical protein